jgi:hypothetical protein
VSCARTAPRLYRSRSPEYVKSKHHPMPDLGSTAPGTSEAANSLGQADPAHTECTIKTNLTSEGSQQ